MQTITAAEAVNVIKKRAWGLFFSVTFFKQDGTMRTMLARGGCKHKTKGGKNTTAHIPQYMTVWSVNDKAFRNVNVNTLVHIKVCGQEFSVSQC